ncbi:MAG TPA: hypothetical protein ENH87_14790 [Pricia antarctica]|uniref:Uncharacterized protein n=1 Tax=Pricia antarctica TaxID=641691 RepID=A0A831VNW1_9FLAO|nr:hypothetical protein [Pricia antarctica]
MIRQLLKRAGQITIILIESPGIASTNPSENGDRGCTWSLSTAPNLQYLMVIPVIDLKTHVKSSEKCSAAYSNRIQLLSV